MEQAQIEDQKVHSNISGNIEENSNIAEENQEKNEISQKTKPSEKPFHLRHDLNQLCFEKRERKNVERFGFGEKSNEKKSNDKNPSTPSKNKKEKYIQKNLLKNKTAYKKKTEKKQIKITNATEEICDQNKIMEKEDSKALEMKEKKDEQVKAVIEKNNNLENNNCSKSKEDAQSNVNKEIFPTALQETVSNSNINGKIIENDSNKQNENAEKNDLNNNKLNLEKSSDLIKPDDNNKKITQNKSAMPFIRKRGRKKKGRWGNKFQCVENNSSNVTNSLNKIFKKNAKKVTFPSHNKKVVTQHNIETTNIFTNIYQEIFTKVETKSDPSFNNNNNNCSHENGEIQNGEAIKEKKSLPQDITLPENKDIKENFLDLNNAIQTINKDFFPVKSYINCDLRHFNFNFLVEKLGYFDIILMDPPWRIKGGQQNDSQFMFSNNKFSLDYNTMSNQAILNLNIQKLSQKGFIFLWILNTQMNVGYEMLNKWGYEVIDQIMWVKLKDNKIFMTHGYYFMHSFEICLVGYKCPIGDYVEYHSKVSNNLIFAEVRKKSQKPDELYEIIDLLMPGSKKIELFARNNNLRPGWFSLGNQLGETYDKWLNILECNNCHKTILKNVARFKSRKIPNYDLCKPCMNALSLNVEDFFEMRNDIDEDVLHHYHKCNQCEVEPIWGIRFSCQECENYDLCEGCYDENLLKDVPFHCIDHKMIALELPLLAHGLPAHCDSKCSGCFQKPIIGPCFSCTVCNNFSLCQSCFFIKNDSEYINSKTHKPSHKMDIKIEPDSIMKKKGIKCAFCEMDISEGEVYKCENCFNFYFCQACHDKKHEFKTNMATTHKPYHNFVRLV